MMIRDVPADNAADLVCVVDDDAWVRSAVTDLLESVGMKAKSFDSVESYLAGLHGAVPACLVLDVRMPGKSGLDFLREMPQLKVACPVVFISGHGDIAMGVTALKLGAVDFLVKPFRDQDLIDAVQRGIAVSCRKRCEDERKASDESRWKTLTAGEQTVALSVCRGLLNKQTAYELGISEVTVKVRRRRALQKLGVANVPELVRLVDQMKTDGIISERGP